MFNFFAARGRPQGSVKKPKQPKATKTKIKIAVKKTKEPKKRKTSTYTRTSKML